MPLYDYNTLCLGTRVEVLELRSKGFLLHACMVQRLCVTDTTKLWLKNLGDVGGLYKYRIRQIFQEGLKLTWLGQKSFFPLETV